MHDTAGMGVPEETALQSATQGVEVGVPDTAHIHQSVLHHHDADGMIEMEVGIVEDPNTKSGVDGAEQYLTTRIALNKEMDKTCQALAFRNCQRLQTMIPNLASCPTVCLEFEEHNIPGLLSTMPV